MADNEEYELPPVPYLNKEFLQSPPARILRILAEYLEPADRLRRAHVYDTIVFFGSARSPSPEQAAEQRAIAGAVRVNQHTTSPGPTGRHRDRPACPGGRSRGRSPGVASGPAGQVAERSPIAAKPGPTGIRVT